MNFNLFSVGIIIIKEWVEDVEELEERERVVEDGRQIVEGKLNSCNVPCQKIEGIKKEMEFDGGGTLRMGFLTIPSQRSPRTSPLHTHTTVIKLKY